MTEKYIPLLARYLRNKEYEAGKWIAEQTGITLDADYRQKALDLVHGAVERGGFTDASGSWVSVPHLGFLCQIGSERLREGLLVNE